MTRPASAPHAEPVKRSARAPIVVGVDVDDSAGSRRAVVWGAEEAVRLNAPLLLVHAAGHPDTFPGETHKRRAEVLLRKARLEVERVCPRLDVWTESSSESPIPLLLARSGAARLIVLGASTRGNLLARHAHSPALAVAGRARCPVVVVRGDRQWQAAQRPVVLGVDGTPASEGAIAVAFEEAARRRSPLVALHARTDTEYRTASNPTWIRLEWEPVHEQESRTLAERLAGWGERYPDVHVDRVVVRDRPRHHLLRWSGRARLLVVGSRGRGGVAAMLLGSTSRALVQHARCPVMVVRPPT